MAGMVVFQLITFLLIRVPGEYVEVISFDSVSQRLVATFRGTFYNRLRDSNYVRKAGDTVVIEDGRIEGTINIQ